MLMRTIEANTTGGDFTSEISFVIFRYMFTSKTLRSMRDNHAETLLTNNYLEILISSKLVTSS